MMSDHKPSEDLEDLDERLHQAREKSQTGKHGDFSSDKELMSGYSMAIRIGTELVAALIVGVGIGYFLDYWLDTKPWFLVVFFFLGAGAGVLNVYRAATGLGMAAGYKEQPSGGVSGMTEHLKRQDTPDGGSENNEAKGGK